MSGFEIGALLVTLTAALSYLNFRFVKLPTTIGLMFLSLAFSLSLIVLNLLGLPLSDVAARILSHIDFHEALMNGMLSFLLFAGSLHVSSKRLFDQKGIITLLSTLGLLISTAVVGFLTYWLFGIFGFNLPLFHCLLFGALISPTDPISVLGLLKTANASQSIQTKIAGESLFNDGVGVVVFIVLERFISSHLPQMGFFNVLILFLREALGGLVLGIAIGFFGFWLLRSIDNYKVEILLTLALVSGGYALANRLQTSGPIAMVVAGLVIGNHGRKFAMSEKTKVNLDLFWGLIDDLLNAVLFVLIGLEILVIHFQMDHWAVSLLCIPAVLFARWVSVAIPIVSMRPFRDFSPHVIKILTWGGLRGGISVALVLSLPESPERNILISATYVVVVFSVIVQGLSFSALLRSLEG